MRRPARGRRFCTGARADLVHGVENILALDADAQAPVLAVVRQVCGQRVEGDGALGGVHHHHHGEVLLHDGLADVQHVDAVFGQPGADAGDDAHLIFTDYRDDCFHDLLSLSFV